MDKDKSSQPAMAPLGNIEPHAAMLKVPSDDQMLYKMMSVKNLLRSIRGNYLHFNRVDAYDDFQGADQNDGRQLPRDQPGNARARFVRSLDFSASTYYDQSRSRTFACCFSMENSNFIWSNYANGGERGKVCAIFNFRKLRSTLNQALQPGNTVLEHDGSRCHQIFSINYGIVEYVDWNSHHANTERLPNPIMYTYLKGTKYSEENELRIALSAQGIVQFTLSDGATMPFPTSVQMAFDFRAAIADGTIQGILLAPDSDSDFLHAELDKLRIVPRENR